MALQLIEFSRSYLQQLITDGLLRRNGQICAKAATKVLAGDQYQLVLRATAQSQAFVPQDIALDVVYEDAHLLIINKPVGMVVHCDCELTAVEDRRLHFTARVYDDVTEIAAATHERYIVDNERFTRKANSKLTAQS